MQQLHGYSRGRQRTLDFRSQDRARSDQEITTVIDIYRKHPQQFAGVQAANLGAVSTRLLEFVQPWAQ